MKDKNFLYTRFMIEKILSSEVREFIRAHENDEVHELLLRHRQIGGVPIGTVADQIIGRNKTKHKLPAFYANSDIVFPPSVNLEQSSSEHTALFKTKILKSSPRVSFGQAIDLTAGLGVDAFYLSKIFGHVLCVEPNIELMEITRHNHRALGRENISYYPGTAENFLSENGHLADFVYVDPSRRRSTLAKVTSFKDCDPDVTKLTGAIFQRANLMLIKASPLMDIQQGIKDLKFVKAVYVVSVDNECKELLFLCERNFVEEPCIEATNLSGDKTQSLGFKVSEERDLTIKSGETSAYLYEPNAAILKAGAFKVIAHKFQLLKVHPNTHLYTSEYLLPDFPGRAFKVESETKPEQKLLQHFFSEQKANIILRNYPTRIADFKKKTGLTEGGEKYLIGFTGVRKKHLVIASRLY
jgi:16S rRNA G966 N2-methylase RsmD